MITLVKNVNNFQPRVLLSISLIFCQFQSGIAYKSVAYKESVYTIKYTQQAEICRFRNYKICCIKYLVFA